MLNRILARFMVFLAAFAILMALAYLLGLI